MISRLSNELRQDDRFIHYVQSSLAEAGRYLGEISEPEILYVIVRLLKPEKVVENWCGSRSKFRLYSEGDE